MYEPWMVMCVCMCVCVSRWVMSNRDRGEQLGKELWRAVKVTAAGDKSDLYRLLLVWLLIAHCLLAESSLMRRKSPWFVPVLYTAEWEIQRHRERKRKRGSPSEEWWTRLKAAASFDHLLSFFNTGGDVSNAWHKKVLSLSLSLLGLCDIHHRITGRLPSGKKTEENGRQELERNKQLGSFEMNWEGNRGEGRQTETGRKRQSDIYPRPCTTIKPSGSGGIGCLCTGWPEKITVMKANQIKL